MILINEWLPNPTGSDAANEWIELFNSGSTPINLSGWKIQNSSGHKFVMKSGVVPANGFLILPRSVTKLSLKNTDESLSLYDSTGVLVDSSHFQGTALEGKSYSRIGASNNFIFATPTSGAPNVTSESLLAHTSVTPGMLATSVPLGIGDVLLLAVGTGIFLATFSLAVVKMHHDLREQFFGRN